MDDESGTTRGGEKSTGSQVTYPKKRAAIACDTCRSRKTRCDGAKPRCSFCEDLDIECKYRRPVEQTRRPETGIEDVLVRVEHQLQVLHRIEALLVNPISHSPGSDRISTAVGPIIPGGIYRGLSQDSSPSIYYSQPLHHQQQQQQQQQTTSPAATLDPDSVASTRIFQTGWADFQNFESHPPLNHIYFDEGDEYTLRENRRGEGFILASSAVGSLDSLDLSLRTVRRYQHHFARNLLSWIPLFDQNFLVSLLEQTTLSHFPENESSTALALLILALGALSNDDYGNTNDDPAGFAGFGYFVHGSRLAAHMTNFTSNIILIQCHVLTSLYLLYTTRELQAWRAITRASSEIPTLFKMKSQLENDPGLHQLAVRAFWSCYVIENELSMKLSPHLSGLSHLLDTMQLPSSEYEDLGSYFFSSAIAIRKLLSRVTDLVSYSKTGNGAVFAPIVALELNKQLYEWYLHLPPILKFPLEGSSMALDPHRAFLRGQYFSIVSVTNWTFILRMVDQPQMEHNQADSINSSASSSSTLIKHARLCVESAISYIYTLESVMFNRHLMLSVHLRCLHSFAVMLLSIYRVPQLEGAMVPGIEPAFWRVVEMLDIWDANETVAVAVRRLRAIARDVGMDRLDGDGMRMN